VVECSVARRLAASRDAKRGGPIDDPEQAISQDGSRIEFTVSGRNGPGEGRLYQRIENGLPDARTVQINASERTVPAASQDATYWGASADGTRVFFTTRENLIDGNNTGNNLYMWSAAPNAEGHHLTLISRNEVGSGSGF
jgi:hypothetical protein